MAFADSSTDELFPELPPLPPREPAWLLCLGILAFAVLLLFTWSSNSSRTPELSFDKFSTAKMDTYRVELLLYQQIDRRELSPPSDVRIHSRATKAANAWRDLSDAVVKEYTLARRRHQKPHYGNEYAARITVNAAALYGAADNFSRAHSLLEEAMTRNPAESGPYRQLLSLYQPMAIPITPSPATAILLSRLSTGPLLRARNAHLTGNRAAELAALLPGERAGRHGEIMSYIYVLFLGIIVILFLIILVFVIIDFAVNGGRTIRFSTYPANKRARAADPWYTPPAYADRPCAADAPSWGIGAALIAISAVFLLIGVVDGAVDKLFHVSSSNLSVALPLGGVVEIVCAVGVLSLFLIIQGKNPWAWSEFGWHTTRKQISYGLATLCFTYPLVMFCSWLSSSLFQDTSDNPMITALEHTTNPWIVLSLFVMASVMAPLVEETLFRGLLFRALAARLPFWGAALVSGFIFAIGHGELVVILPITILGIAFAYLARKTGNLWPSAIAHGVFNTLASLAILLAAWAMHGPGS